MIVYDPVNAFNMAYRGYQYPLPHSWRYAIRLEDQIEWLLQALMCLNEYGINSGDLAEAETDIYNSVIAALRKEIEALRRRIDMIAEQGSICVNPVTGLTTSVSVAVKQMWDMLRTRAMSWNELQYWAETQNLTWDAFEALGYTYFDVDMFSNNYFGDGDLRYMFTPTANINADVTQTEVSESTIMDLVEQRLIDWAIAHPSGHTYGEIDSMGFIYEV